LPIKRTPSARERKREEKKGKKKTGGKKKGGTPSRRKSFFDVTRKVMSSYPREKNGPALGKGRKLGGGTRGS